MKKYYLPNNSSGFIAISTVMILLVVVLSISTTIALLSIGEGQSSLALSLGEEGLHFTEGCVEDTLQKVRKDASYSGSTLSRPEGTCTVTINSKVGNVWTITITPTTPSLKYTRIIQVVITRGPTVITLTSWKEI